MGDGRHSCGYYWVTKSHYHEEHIPDCCGTIDEEVDNQISVQSKSNLNLLSFQLLASCTDICTVAGVWEYKMRIGYGNRRRPCAKIRQVVLVLYY